MAEENKETRTEISAGIMDDLKTESSPASAHAHLSSVKARLAMMVRNKTLEADEFGDRLKTELEFISTLSGFIAGFTYIVTNGVPEYKESKLSGFGIDRADLFHVLVILSFLASLASTLISFLMMGSLTAIGMRNSVVFFEAHSTMG